MLNEELLLVAIEKAVFNDSLTFNEVMERFEGKIDKYQLIDLWEKLRTERRIQRHLKKIEEELKKINFRNGLLKELREFKENKSRFKDALLQNQILISDYNSQKRVFNDEVWHISKKHKC